jgi:molecular chaperone HscB
MLKVIDSAVPVECWSCAVAHNESTLFCPHCSKIQPATAGDYFSVFSLVPKLDLDLGMLEHQFHKLSRKLHPDRFARATANEKEWSLADTALLNDAYRTLRDPIRRTEYLLKLQGAEIGEEHAGRDRRDPSRVPADLLEEAFDLNMQLEEMRMSKKMGDGDPELHSSRPKGNSATCSTTSIRICALNGSSGTKATKVPARNRKRRWCLSWIAGATSITSSAT